MSDAASSIGYGFSGVSEPPMPPASSSGFTGIHGFSSEPDADDRAADGGYMTLVSDESKGATKPTQPSPRSTTNSAEFAGPDGAEERADMAARAAAARDEETARQAWAASEAARIKAADDAARIAGEEKAAQIAAERELAAAEKAAAEATAKASALEKAAAVAAEAAAAQLAEEERLAAGAVAAAAAAEAAAEEAVATVRSTSPAQHCAATRHHTHFC